MYSIHDLNIPQENINDADAWLLTAYAWDEQGEYEKAVFCMTKAAELGSVLAYTYLARYYEQGQGVTRDFVKAAECCAKVADHPEPLYYSDFLFQSQAAYSLGYYHEQGLLPDASAEQAALWYHKALSYYPTPFRAAPAIALARLYLYGRGVEQNSQKAFDLLHVACCYRLDVAEVWQMCPLCAHLLTCEDVIADAEQHLFLLDQLSVMYDEGYGGDPDPVQAQQCRQKAAEIRKTHPSQPEPVSIPRLINGEGVF